MSDFDAIVVGAGHNGLVAALYLSRSGWRVLVIETADEVGGGLRSGSLTGDGFCHDYYATSVGLFASSPVYQEFGADLRAQGVRFLTSETSYANVFSRSAVGVYGSVEKTKSGLANIAPSEALGWHKLMEFFKRTSPTFLPLFSMEVPSRAMLSQLVRVAALGPSDVAELVRLVSQSAGHFMSRRFQSMEARSLVTSWSLHSDYGPDTAGGALIGFIPAAAAQANGIPIVEGGAGRISEALRALLEQAGGRVRTRSNVTKILVRDGRAHAVRLSSGEEIEAGKAIIANVTPKNLFGQLVSLEDVPTSFAGRIEKYRYGPATFIIHLALSRLPAWRLSDELSRFTYVHINSNEDEMRRTYSDAHLGLLPVKPLLIVSQTTSLDPTRAPAGKHVVRIHVRVVPSTILGDAAGIIRDRSWREVKAQYADRILDLVEEHVPDIRSCIISMAVESPAEVEASNPNFVGGDCLSGSQHFDQNFFFRPLPGWSRYRTPIDALYMVGAATWPGGGVNARSGYLVARRLLQTSHPA